MKKNAHSILIVLGLCLILICCALFLTLQSKNPADERGTINGNVVDASGGAPVRGVTVTAVDQDGNKYTEHDYSDTTGSDGYFSLELPPENYTLLFEADGYDTLSSSASYEVSDGKTVEIGESFRLSASSADGSQNAVPGGDDSMSVSSYNQDDVQNLPSGQDGAAPANVPTSSPVNYTVLCLGPSGEELGSFPNAGSPGTTITVAAPLFTDYQPDMPEKSIALAQDQNNVVTFYYSQVNSASAPVSNAVNNPANNMSIPGDAVIYNGHSYYLYVPGGGSWDDVLASCASKGGYPAVINDSGENEFLFDYMVSSGLDGTYFGLTDTEKEGEWKWVYGKQSDFSDWGINSRGQYQPNSESPREDWAQMNVKMYDGHWNDCRYGQNTYSYFCEWDAVQ